MQNVPCHGEFFRYVQWHNLANQVVKDKPTLVVHYEDYNTQWNRTANKILKYLHLEQKHPLRPFRYHSYDEYFSDADRESGRALIQQLATPAIWEQLEHYFDTPADT
jgi:hypothetical protein